MRPTVIDETAHVAAPEQTFLARHRDALRFWIPIVSTTVIVIGLRTLIPPYINWFYPHDDTALVQTAASILAGDWLGDWGDHAIAHMTLAKVPGYSLFLAAIQPTGLTPPVAAILLYLPGALLLALGTRRHLGIRWAAVLYIVLAFNPVLYSADFSRVYRDQLVIALAMLMLGLTTHLAALLFGGRRITRGTVVAITVETLALGLAYALLLITRNDVYWVWAATAGVLFVVLLARGRTLTVRRGAALGAIAGVVVGLAMTGPATVRAINEDRYGVALTNDYSKGNLALAVRLWASVVVEESEPRALVDAGQRAAAYEVSPTAAELGTWLETNPNWVGLACSLQPDETPCDDYVGYFTWALRDAAVANGVDSPAALQDYFGRLVDELEAACASGELTCGARALSPNVPAVSEIPVRTAFSNLVSYINASLIREPVPSSSQKPTDSSTPVDLWLRTVNGSGTVMAMADSGTQATAIEMTAVQILLRSVYLTFLLPAAILTLAMLFRRHLWTTTTGRMALVCLAAWGMNLTIVAIFYASVNRNMAAQSPIYIQASQSYLLAGLVLVIAVGVGRLRDWARPFTRTDDLPA